MFSLLSIFGAVALACCLCRVLADSQQLSWSINPATSAILENSEAGWHSVNDTELKVFVDVESVILISYSATVIASKSFLPGGDFAGESADSFLGMRISVDGIPYRQSGSHSNPVSSFETVRTSLSGHLVVTNLAAGSHVIQLEWRSWGSDTTRWSIRPSLLGGYGGSRSITAQSRFKYLYHSQPLTVSQITYPGNWTPVEGCQLEFALPREWTLYIFYSLQARPQLPPNTMGTYVVCQTRVLGDHLLILIFCFLQF